MPEKRLRTSQPQSDEAPPEGKKPGFTLVELLISMTLFLVVMASTVGLLMSQRTLYDVQSDRMALQRSVRASVDLISSELRAVPTGGVSSARPDSVTFHYPIRWGLICGLATDSAGAAQGSADMFLRAAEDALFEYQVQSGYGVREPGGSWAFFEEPDPLWGDTLMAASLYMCKEGSGAKFQATTTYNKDGTINQYADTASVDYPRFNDFTTITGSVPVTASEFIVYSNITYLFGPSAFDPGTRALFRNMPGAEQELSGLFSDDAGFEYVLEDGTVTNNVGVGQAHEVVEVRIKALGYKEVNTSGTLRSLEYAATVAVPLRDRGG